MHSAYVLTEKVAVHVRAVQTFKDGSGKARKSGEEYLITIKARLKNLFLEMLNFEFARRKIYKIFAYCCSINVVKNIKPSS